jgi:hypothetical protein
VSDLADPKLAERMNSAAAEAEDARRHLLSAMKALDSSETRALHVRFAEELHRLDDLRSLLAERSPV